MSIGIDFGTTNSVVARFAEGTTTVLSIDQPLSDEWRRAGFDRVLPSVYALDARGNAMFGWAAKEAGLTKVEAVKRLFARQDVVDVDGQSVLVEEVAAMLFSRLRHAAALQGIEFSRAVVSIPANSRGLARYRTKLCAGLAGIEVAALINEPTAAAMAFGLDLASDQRVLVVDWGGGTLDVTLLQVDAGIFVEHASKGIQSLGGRDFDRCLHDHLLADTDTDDWSAGDRRRFDLDVELAKIRLTDEPTALIRFPDGHGRHVTRAELEKWTRPLVERAREPIETCLFDGAVSTDAIDHLVLIGGTCMIPTVREYVCSLVGREASAGCNPLTAVAEGAAVAGAILEGSLDADFFVSTEHALGTIAMDGGVARFSEIIARNHKLPARETQTYFTMDDFQQGVHLRVIEGDPVKPLDHEDNVVLREWEVPFPPRPAGSPLDITYEYDVSGLLHVSVVDVTSGDTVMRGDVGFVETVSPQDLVKMRHRVDDVAHDVDAASERDDPLPDEVRVLLERARRKVIPFVEDDEATRIEDLALALELAALAGDYAEPLGALDESLRKHAYLY